MRRTPLTVAGASVALAITLAACGGDDSGDATPEPTSGGGGGSELVVRRYTDGHVSASLGPVDPSADAPPPPSSPLPPPARFT